MHVRRGDTVVVIAGKEKGKRGRILRVVNKKDRVVVERINMIKRHTKPTQQSPRGGIIEKEGTVPVSNVLVWCGKCSKGVRTRHETTEAKDKKRVCSKCGTQFEAA